MNSKRPDKEYNYLSLKRRKTKIIKKDQSNGNKLKSFIFNATQDTRQIRPILSHPFGNPMNNETFLDMVKKMMNYKAKELTGDRKTAFLACFSSIDFESFFSGSVASIELKRDILLDIISSKGIKYDYFPILRTKGNLIKKVDINSLIQIHCELPSDTLQKIAISPIYLDAYQKVLSYQDIEKSKEEIQKKVLEIISELEVYQAPLIKNICGCTIYSGKVFIRQRYVNSITKKKSKKIQALASIISTILHEIMHIILRKFHQTEDYYISTMPQEINSRKIKDSGTMIDLTIFNGFSYLFYDDAKFLLNPLNYNLKTETFKEKFLEIRKEKRKDKEFAKKEKYTLTKVIDDEDSSEPEELEIDSNSSDNESDGEFYYKGICKFEYSRRKTDW